MGPPGPACQADPNRRFAPTLGLLLGASEGALPSTDQKARCFQLCQDGPARLRIARPQASRLFIGEVQTRHLVVLGADPTEDVETGRTRFGNRRVV